MPTAPAQHILLIAATHPKDKVTQPIA